MRLGGTCHPPKGKQPKIEITAGSMLRKQVLKYGIWYKPVLNPITKYEQAYLKPGGGTNGTTIITLKAQL